MPSQPKWPEIAIPMIGEDSNAFSIIGRCLRLAKNYLSEEELLEFQTEAVNCNSYEQLLQTVMHWFSVELMECSECGGEEYE